LDVTTVASVGLKLFAKYFTTTYAFGPNPSYDPTIVFIVAMALLCPMMEEYTSE